MKIRKAESKDLDELIKLDKMAHEEKEWWIEQNKKEFERIIKERKFYLFVAESDSLLLGYLQAEKKKNKIQIENIYVKKDYRKKGIAKCLINFFLNNNNARLVELVTSDDNL